MDIRFGNLESVTNHLIVAFLEIPDRHPMIRSGVLEKKRDHYLLSGVYGLGKKGFKRMTGQTIPIIGPKLQPEWIVAHHDVSHVARINGELSGATKMTQKQREVFDEDLKYQDLVHVQYQTHLAQAPVQSRGCVGFLWTNDDLHYDVSLNLQLNDVPRVLTGGCMIVRKELMYNAVRIGTYKDVLVAAKEVWPTSPALRAVGC